ncbi:MAG: DsrE family protein [Saprospiraceae bacterium]|jgi:hypothetical protein
MNKYIRSGLLLVLLLLTAGSQVFAQNKAKVVSTKKHKIVIQLASKDPKVYEGTLRQLNNLLNAAPNAKVEVVCHSGGLQFLMTKDNPNLEKIAEFAARGVDFAACENTMTRWKVSREELVKDCRTVPAGLLEVVMKQEKGYSYLKAGP